MLSEVDGMATALEPSATLDAPPEASDRSVGLVFAAVFLIIGAFPLLHLAQPRWWAIIVAVLLGLVALLKPAILHPLSRVWLGLGRLLHKIVSPVVMGAIFFLCVTPIGWIQRARGRDILSLRRSLDAKTYWIARETQPSGPDAMKRQF